MSIQITILGLERIGTAIGLALAKLSSRVERIGFDENDTVALQAQKANAIDRIGSDLPASVIHADVIVLALPFDKVQQTLKAISGHVRADAIILDTSPVKEPVKTWMEKFLPTGCHYVGMLLNSAGSNGTVGISGVDGTVRFENFPVGIAAPAGTAPGAIDLVAELARLMGGHPFFCDLAEMDGLAASTGLLPQLVSSALLIASLDQPGWKDARNFAGMEFAAASAGIAGNNESASLCEAILLNKTNLLRNLDGYLAAMQGLRTDIENCRYDQLEERLEHARLGRLQWIRETHDQSGQTGPVIDATLPTPGDYWKQQIGFLARAFGTRPSKPKKKD
jgi:prephenate dehydrogenase